LHRTPDQAGHDAWVNALNNGATRSAVVLSFSESHEHTANTLDAIQSENPAHFGIAFA
jgi:hypothetical protein